MARFLTAAASRFLYRAEVALWSIPFLAALSTADDASLYEVCNSSGSAFACTRRRVRLIRVCMVDFRTTFCLRWRVLLTCTKQLGYAGDREIIHRDKRVITR